MSQKSGQPKSKFPDWQGSEPISYKTKFSQRDNTYLVDLKYNITYQNIRRKTKARLFFMPEKPKLAKKLLNKLQGWAFYKIAKFALTKKDYQ